MLDNQTYAAIMNWLGADSWMTRTWVAQVFVVVFMVLLCALLLRVVLRRLRAKMEAAPNIWSEALLTALRGPANLLLWVIGFSIVARVIHAETQSALFSALEPVRSVGVVGAIAWFVIRLTQALQNTMLRRSQAAGRAIDITTIGAIGKLLRASIWVTAGLVIMQTLGFSISGILAFGGIGGIAIGFAARDLLANFFGGLMLYLDRPFVVGDWVRSPDREIEGTVEEIGWRITRIRSFDMRPIYVPNGVFSTMAIVNPSRMTNRQIYETIGIRYADADKMADIVGAVEAMLKTHADIDQTQTLIVNFNRFAPSSLEFFVYAFTRTTKWVAFHRVKQDVLLNIYAVIRAHDAEIAYPTSTIHMPVRATWPADFVPPPR